MQKPDDNARLFECPICKKTYYRGNGNWQYKINTATKDHYKYIYYCSYSCMRKAETSHDNIPEDSYEEIRQKIIYMYKERGQYSETIAAKCKVSLSFVEDIIAELNK